MRQKRPIGEINPEGQPRAPELQCTCWTSEYPATECPIHGPRAPGVVTSIDIPEGNAATMICKPSISGWCNYHEQEWAKCKDGSNNSMAASDNSVPVVANCDEVIERLTSDKSDYKVRLDAAALIVELREKLTTRQADPVCNQMLERAQAEIAKLQDERDWWQQTAKQLERAIEITPSGQEIARLKAAWARELLQAEFMHWSCTYEEEASVPATYFKQWCHKRGIEIEER